MNSRHWTTRHRPLAAAVAACIAGTGALPLAAAAGHRRKPARREIAKWSRVVKQAHITAE